MKPTAVFPRVAKDIFFVQLMWTGGFLGIMLIVNIVKLIFAGIKGNEAEGFFSSIFVAGNIYMLIIGILAIYFLPHFVGNGVTRKDYFIGTVLASIGLSIIIPIITLLVSVLERLILNILDITLKGQTINEVDVDGAVIGDIVQSIIISPYVDPQSNLFLAISVLSLNLLVIYLIGWLISSSFYRFDTVVGIGFILIGLNLKMLKDTFLRISLDLPIPGWYTKLDILPISFSLIGILLIILISIWFIRLLTKKVAIKM
ncbi:MULTISPECIES: hypothetical protein [unclassified Fredinandcohnia]|uniref:hypothetical protein n=1 Tax=unclassified Fredinandcohnia TaxID=2837514 RepID=UPI0030FD7E00